MELPLEEQEKIYYMALLHDIGKIGIPDAILKEFTAIPGIADGARYHHEFYDGSGYCEGLKGKEIPLLARIIAVADAFDAMCSKRYYHDGNTADYVKGEMIRCSGKAGEIHLQKTGRIQEEKRCRNFQEEQKTLQIRSSGG